MTITTIAAAWTHMPEAMSHLRPILSDHAPVTSWAFGGSTPSTLMLTALPADRRETVRQRMQSRFAFASPTVGLEIGAEALVVRGRA
jgi:hypothetical protein